MEEICENCTWYDKEDGNHGWCMKYRSFVGWKQECDNWEVK